MPFRAKKKCLLIRVSANNFSMRVWPEFRRGKEICPLIRATRLLECPLIGDYTFILINMRKWIILIQ